MVREGGGRRVGPRDEEPLQETGDVRDRAEEGDKTKKTGDFTSNKLLNFLNFITLVA